jgi:small subunit ribosomal protein S13
MIYMGTYKISSSKKPIKLALTDIYGIGLSRAWRLHYRIGAHTNQRLCHTKRVQRRTWLRKLKRRALIGDLLKTLKRDNLKRLKYIKSYRGVRHSLYLPSRGQRTHSNRRTSRYLKSGTWHYVPTIPISKLKKLSKYVQHKKKLVEKSNDTYGKLLSRNFAQLQKNKRYFKQLSRQNKLAQFTKLAKQNKVLTFKKNKKKK